MHCRLTNMTMTDYSKMIDRQSLQKIHVWLTEYTAKIEDHGFHVKPDSSEHKSWHMQNNLKTVLSETLNIWYLDRMFTVRMSEN